MEGEEGNTLPIKVRIKDGYPSFSARKEEKVAQESNIAAWSKRSILPMQTEEEGRREGTEVPLWYAREGKKGGKRTGVSIITDGVMIKRGVLASTKLSGNEKGRQLISLKFLHRLDKRRNTT